MRRKQMSGKTLNIPALKKLLRYVFKQFPWLLSGALLLMVFNAVISSIPSVFSQQIISIVQNNWESGDWQAVSQTIIGMLVVLGVLYLISLIAGFIARQILVYVAHKSIMKLRIELFSKLQTLPVQFFDTHAHGDVMSHLTNDVDMVKDMISQSLSSVLTSFVIVLTVFSLMLYFSLWLTLVVLVGVGLMIFVSGKLGGLTGKYYGEQQAALGKVEGFVEEMIHGQKVVKVFNRQEKTMEEFKSLNHNLQSVSESAARYSSLLMPILNNIGNITYVLLVLVGGLLIVNNVTNISISGLALQISVLVPFLSMSRQFTGNISSASMHLSFVGMASAGASRIFELMDKESELDEGNVTLVQKEPTPDNKHSWYWDVPNEGLRPVLGDVRFDNVTFGYVEDQPILKNISLYGEPGQKIAFVGATGAGKTTITNLINRFYEVENGTITYDGIPIKQIKKADLRKSMGMVLQDINLFSGTILDNLRYGNLEATYDECVHAAKLARADYFIRLLDQGYETVISGSQESLSNGQRQMLSIARAEVANPPVMILDEATSSIDTHTESYVQKGMDELMKGRTVFVIAHRLSTVKNSDVIMVLEKGEIIERGSHDSLLEQKGKYYELYTGGLELD